MGKAAFESGFLKGAQERKYVCGTCGAAAIGTGKSQPAGWLTNIFGPGQWCSRACAEAKKGGA